MNRIGLAACVLGIVGGFAPMATAQAPFLPHAATSVLRGAAVDSARGVLYVSAYEPHEVWEINLATGETIATVPVQDGPTALALSADGKTLACANRIANSVSLINTADLTVRATIPTMEGAADVAALPGGGFAVANSFGDNVALIDPERPDAVVRIDKVASVPSSVAASDSFLGVTTRTPPALLLFSGGSHTPDATVELPEGPSVVYALAGDRFVVGAKNDLVLVDAKSHKIVTKLSTPVYDLAVRGGSVYALTDGAVQAYDQSLAPTTRSTFDGVGRDLAAGDGILVVLDPKKKSWLISGKATPTMVAEKLEPKATSPASKAAPVIKESTPAPAAPAKKELAPTPPAPAPVKTAEAKPEASAAPSKAPASPEPVEGNKGSLKAEAKAEKKKPAVEKPHETQAAPIKTAEVAPAPAPSEPAKAGEGTTKSASESKSTYTWGTRQERIREGGVTPTPEPKKKEPPRKPSGSPFSGASKPKGFGQTVSEGISLGAAATAFQPPDWTQPFRDLKADHIETIEGGTKIIAEGNVHLTKDTVQFASDHFFYDKTTGEMHVSGNVEIIQNDSTAFADDVVYKMSTDKKLELPPPLAPAGSDVQQDISRKALSLGQLEASNLEVHEPEREFKADRLDYDFTTSTGEAYGVEGQAGQIRFGGEKFKILSQTSMEGSGMWLTTCDCDHEYYKIRLKKATFGKGNEVTGTDANLQLGSVRTPVYWPKWNFSGQESPTIGVDLDSGHAAKLGYYLNVGQEFAISPDAKLGIRFFPTTKQGIGFGLDGSYDYMETPASPLFRGKGEFHTLYTTEGRGYTDWYHRQEIDADTILLVQLEQWYDKDVYKDFYYDKYKDRSEPRTFANVTYTQPTYIATATVKPRTNGFTTETERLPEATFHVLEREVASRLYLTFDTIDGYNNREPRDENAIRSINVGRLSYDLELGKAVNVTPFVEIEGSWYSQTRDNGPSDTRLSSLTGVTVSSRFQKTYPGAWGFSEFRHLVVPSVTYSYRPEPSMGVEKAPHFDSYDQVFGRSRLESKIDNIILGRDAESGESWQVARLSLYEGTDFWNEVSKSNDFELEAELRPRPWWGFMAVGEHHDVGSGIDLKLDEPYSFERTLVQIVDRLTDQRLNPETIDRYNASYGSYDRVLAYLYYDDRAYNGRWNGRLGYAYTESLGDVFNREVIYGLGYKLNDKWSMSFEHVFDLETGDLSRQKYEIRRVMNCLEGAFQFSERESGWDVGVEFSVTALPGTKLKL